MCNQAIQDPLLRLIEAVGYASFIYEGRERQALVIVVQYKRQFGAFDVEISYAIQRTEDRTYLEKQSSIKHQGQSSADVLALLNEATLVADQGPKVAFMHLRGWTTAYFQPKGGTVARNGRQQLMAQDMLDRARPSARYGAGNPDFAIVPPSHPGPVDPQARLTDDEYLRIAQRDLPGPQIGPNEELIRDPGTVWEASVYNPHATFISAPALALMEETAAKGPATLPLAAVIQDAIETGVKPPDHE